MRGQKNENWREEEEDPRIKLVRHFGQVVVNI